MRFTKQIKEQIEAGHNDLVTHVRGALSDIRAIKAGQQGFKAVRDLVNDINHRTKAQNHAVRARLHQLEEQNDLLFSMVDNCSKVIDLMAKELGVKVEVVPEREAHITLKKLPKKAK